MAIAFITIILLRVYWQGLANTLISSSSSSSMRRERQ